MVGVRDNRGCSDCGNRRAYCLSCETQEKTYGSIVK